VDKPHLLSLEAEPLLPSVGRKPVTLEVKKLAVLGLKSSITLTNVKNKEILTP